jgi:hypothetical protein
MHLSVSASAQRKAQRVEVRWTCRPVDWAVHRNSGSGGLTVRRKRSGATSHINHTNCLWWRATCYKCTDKSFTKNWQGTGPASSLDKKNYLNIWRPKVRTQTLLKDQCWCLCATLGHVALLYHSICGLDTESFIKEPTRTELIFTIGQWLRSGQTCEVCTQHRVLVLHGEESSQRR